MELVVNSQFTASGHDVSNGVTSGIVHVGDYLYGNDSFVGAIHRIDVSSGDMLSKSFDADDVYGGPAWNGSNLFVPWFDLPFAGWNQVHVLDFGGGTISTTHSVSGSQPRDLTYLNGSFYGINVNDELIRYITPFSSSTIVGALSMNSPTHLSNDGTNLWIADAGLNSDQIFTVNPSTAAVDRDWETELCNV